MQSLRNYLNNTQQYEGILDPSQDQIMSRMTDDAIRRCIREYCTWERQEHQYSVLWPAGDVNLKITKIDKDKQGWYIETSSVYAIFLIYNEKKAKSFYEYCLSKGQKIDEQKGFLIEDLGIYFRWRKHKGILAACDCPILESTDGLPEEIDVLQLFGSCGKSKKFIVRNKIKVIEIDYINNLKISGNACKHIVVHPNNGNVNIVVPSGTQLHSPDGEIECTELAQELSKS